MPAIIPNWHPIFVHFTIALYVMAAVLYAVAQIAAGRDWASRVLFAARVNLWAGAVLSILTVAAGIHAFLTVSHEISQEPFMADHRRWAMATAIIWWLIAIWEAWRAIQGKRAGLIVGSALILALGPLVVTGWKGGELVSQNGIGVIAEDVEALDRCL
jgi:uncharacterized membrane protein